MEPVWACGRGRDGSKGMREGGEVRVRAWVFAAAAVGEENRGERRTGFHPIPPTAVPAKLLTAGGTRYTPALAGPSRARAGGAMERARENRCAVFAFSAQLAGEPVSCDRQAVRLCQPTRVRYTAGTSGEARRAEEGAAAPPRTAVCVRAGCVFSTCSLLFA